jgi:CDP-paratose 2-epimerase
MKILITGGCGFLGSNLASDALQRGDKVFIFDNLSREGARKNLGWLINFGKFNFQHGDIRIKNDITRSIIDFQPDVIYHLAGQVAMTTSIENPNLDFEINVVGTFNLLEAVRLYSSGSIIIYSSTNKVYGSLEQFSYGETDTRYICNEHTHGFSEDVQLDFHSPYGCSKGSADQYMLDYSRIFNLKTVVFRHSSMYGGRQFATYDQGWIGWFCQKAHEIKNKKNKENFTISGTGKQVRDVLHSEDMQRLYISAVYNIDKAKGQAFNIGGGHLNSLSLLELFVILEDEIREKIDYTKIEVRESDQKVFIADISKAKQLLDWEPKINAKTGINMMLDWVSKNTL